MKETRERSGGEAFGEVQRIGKKNSWARIAVNLTTGLVFFLFLLMGKNYLKTKDPALLEPVAVLGVLSGVFFAIALFLRREMVGYSYRESDSRFRVEHRGKVQEMAFRDIRSMQIGYKGLELTDEEGRKVFVNLSWSRPVLLLEYLMKEIEKGRFLENTEENLQFREYVLEQFRLLLEKIKK